MLSANSEEKVSSNQPKSPYIQPNPLLFCIFCEVADHFSHECEKFKSSAPFWKKILDDRRCKNCLRLYHRSEKCYNYSFCNVFNCRRKDKHSPVICYLRYVKNYSHHVIGGHKRFSPKFYVPYKIGSRRWQQQINWKAYNYRHKYYFSNSPDNTMNGCNTESTSYNLSSQCTQPNGANLPPKTNFLTQPLLCEELEVLHAVENVPRDCPRKVSDVCVPLSTSLQNSSFVDNHTDSSLFEHESFEPEPTVLENPSQILVEAYPGVSSIGPAVTGYSTNPKYSSKNSIPDLSQFLRIAVNKCSRFSNALLKLSQKELSSFTNSPQGN